MKTTFNKGLLATLGAGLVLGFSASPLPADDDVADQSVAANYVVTVADDFVVDIYQNGKVVPDSSRHMISETFGAMAERTDIEVHRGDWLVFHVVNNRLRWGGSYYFGAAGLFEKDESGFVSNLCSGDWSYCDNPSRARKFISKKDFMSNHAAQPISRAWGDGTRLMKQYAGDSWSGEPLWGCSRDTWLKLIVP